MKTSNALRHLNQIMILLGLLLCALIAAFLYSYSSNIFGIAQVKILNNSGETIHNIAIELACSSTKTTEKTASLPHGKTIHISRMCSDLMVNSVHFEWRGIRHTGSGGTISTPGDILVLTINSEGKISSTYAPH